ncbi:hypothetical protein Vadar_024078 [Vaccinium darrowii]|uniref:Uncharacterized protein n=1 Tax=Vaccinium darrowii TaxID=229202 RepID=A0ACB7ZMK7_9ERIC|nr:hypothetical protein Vadar_024078 [Vaccinium darrowii]
MQFNQTPISISDGWNYFSFQEKQEFLGLTLARSSSEATSLQLAYGDDGIVGVLDSGFQTELMCESFSTHLAPAISFLLRQFFQKLKAVAVVRRWIISYGRRVLSP